MHILCTPEMELRPEDWKILFAAYGNWADKISLEEITKITHLTEGLVSFRVKMLVEAGYLVFADNWDESASRSRSKAWRQPRSIHFFLVVG